jgi:hypothetical protein
MQQTPSPGRLALTFLVVAGLLTACTHTPTLPGEDDPAIWSIAGTVQNPGAVSVAGLSLLLLNPIVLDGGGGGDDDRPLVLADAPLETFHLLGLSAIAGDGTFELPLALPPTTFLVPVERALFTGMGSGCELVVSTEGVMATLLGFEGIAIPNLVGLTYLGASFSYALASDHVIDLDADPATWLEGKEILSWIYADGTTTVVSDEATCAAPYVVFDFDLMLSQGWNQVAFTFTPAVGAEQPPVIGLRNAPNARPFVTVTGVPLGF